jgi:hypothetical protein
MANALSVTKKKQDFFKKKSVVGIISTKINIPFQSITTKKTILAKTAVP